MIQQLPHISRFISATLFPRLGKLTLWSGIIVLFVLNSFILANYTPLTTEKPVLGAETSDPTTKQFWQTVVAQHPEYTDGYLQLAKIAYGEKNISETQGYLETALRLDPNNTEIERLLKGVTSLQ